MIICDEARIGSWDEENVNGGRQQDGDIALDIRSDDAPRPFSARS